MSEKFVLVRKELHLGYVKETFRAGAVIEHDEEKHVLVVDGRKFTDCRDLEVLKRQAENNPDNPWIVPWSEKAVKEAKASFPIPEQKRKPKPGENMKVVRSDEDLMDTDIDIRDTQVSKKNAAAKQAARDKVKTHGMEIIRGDETVEERIASLKGKNDLTSMSERVRLKATGSAKMQVVKDDSLGSVAGGSRAAAMNAGQVIPSRAEVEAKTAAAKAAADARKRDADARRAKTVQEGSEAGEGDVGLLDAEKTPTGAAGAVPGASEGGEVGKDAEIAALKAKLAALEGKSKRKPVTSVKMAKRVVGA